MTTRERALLLPDVCARCGGEVAWHVLSRRDWPRERERLVCEACDRPDAEPVVGSDIGGEIPTIPTAEAPRERMPRWAALLLAVGIAAPFLVIAGLLILLGEGR